MTKTRPDPLEHLTDSERLIVVIYLTALVIIQGCRNCLRPWLFPERRKLRVHWVGERRRTIRPVHLLPTVFLAELILLLIVTCLSPINAFAFGLTGNLIIVALAMLPSISLKQKGAVL
jgi:hypothetical protein